MRLRTSTKTSFYLQKLNSRMKIAKGKGLYQVAGLIRTATKRALRVSRGPSSPGSPPHAHTRGGLRIIEFVVNAAKTMAMIGPVKFSGSNFFNQPVTYIHEFGGAFFSRRGFFRYPERSYMYSTLKRLQAQKKILPGFTIHIRKQF